MVQIHPDEEDSYELRTSSTLRDPDDFDYSSSFEDDGVRAGLLTEEQSTFRSRSLLASFLTKLFPVLYSKSLPGKYPSRTKRQRTTCLRPSVVRKIAILVFITLAAITFLQAIFFPSYTTPPPHYRELRSRAQSTDTPGRANPDQKQIFIAASIFDKHGDLAGGAWAESVLGLIDLLGTDNVYLSIYENDAGAKAETALLDLEKKISCDHTLKFERHLSLDEVPHIQLPDGSDRVKRIAYLADVRNRALLPLQNSRKRYDKMLYINDVIFDPVDAVQLLFSTNVDDSGHAQYRAACAVDFINPFKYYDTFATRDSEGYGIGVPFFPWFTSVASGTSRKDVIAGSDAVRVRSCWGGMVAFDAQFFQQPSVHQDVPPTAGGQSPKTMATPYQFRAEDDLYWDASECCLIHADIQDPNPHQTGIYMNPYVRVAYDKGTLSWLGITRRFERLYTPVHYLINKAVGMPWYNPRRDERVGEKVTERVWVPDTKSAKGGSFQEVERMATHSGFCGRRALQVLKTNITGEGKNWEFLPIPE